jgi:hypothetical protein
VPANGAVLSAFRYHVTCLWRRSLRRRSQKDAPHGNGWGSWLTTGCRNRKSFTLGRTSGSPSNTEVGAVCGSSARTDLCGGCSVTGVPTAIICCWFPKRSRGRGAVLTLSWDRDPPFSGTEITRDPRAEDHPSQARFAGVGQAARQCEPSSNQSLAPLVWWRIRLNLRRAHR